MCRSTSRARCCRTTRRSPQIRKAVTGRFLSELETLAEKDAAQYEKIWDAFGSVLKEGLYEDFERRDQLLKIARFRTTAGPGWRSLAQYVAGMKPNQTEIYYVSGNSLDLISSSPQLEAAKARGVEVLLMADPVDHFWTSMGQTFDGKPLKSLTHGEADLSAIPAEGEAKPEPKADDIAPVVSALKEALGDAVSDVRASKLLVTSAVCLAAPDGGPDRGLERLLQRQNRGMGSKPVLEFNPSHPADQGPRRRDRGRTHRGCARASGIFSSTRPWCWRASCRPTRRSSPSG